MAATHTTAAAAPLLPSDMDEPQHHQHQHEQHHHQHHQQHQHQHHQPQQHPVPKARRDALDPRGRPVVQPHDRGERQEWPRSRSSSHRDRWLLCCRSLPPSSRRVLSVVVCSLLVGVTLLVVSSISSSSSSSSHWCNSSSRSAVSPVPSADSGGGATSGREINLYRARTAPSSFSPPSAHQHSVSPFLSLASLVDDAVEHSSSSSSVGVAAGLDTLVRCIATSSRVAVMTSIAQHPTAAEVGLAVLGSPWCVLIIGDMKGPSFAHFTAAEQLDAGISSYLDKMNYTGQKDTPGREQISHERLLQHIAYIDITEQKLLPYSLHALTPYASFSRKNLGFLLAFHCQASVVFDVDDDNIYLPNSASLGNSDLPVDLQPRLYPASDELDLALHTKGKVDSSIQLRHTTPPQTDLLPLNVSVFNPYPLYGAEDAWPRGFPLNHVRATLRGEGSYSGRCVTKERRCVAVVQQMLANHDPDVDAIFRLTNERGMPFYFLAAGRAQTKPAAAASTPSIALPSSTLAPFNAQATLITPGAFFAMLLPFTVHGRVSDIWRSYIMETLLTYYTLDAHQHIYPRPTSSSATHTATYTATSSLLVEPCVVFTAPHIYHDRNAHQYQLDFNSELPLYLQSETLVSWLTARQAGGLFDLRQAGVGVDGSAAAGSATVSVSMADIMWRLYVALYESGVVEEPELDYVQAWLTDFARMPQPKRVAHGEREAQQDDQPSGKCWPKYAQ